MPRAELEPRSWWSGPARVEEVAAWGVSVCEEQCRELLALVPRKFDMGAQEGNLVPVIVA